MHVKKIEINRLWSNNSNRKSPMFDTGAMKTMYFSERNECVLYENQQSITQKSRFDQKKKSTQMAYYDFGFWTVEQIATNTITFETRFQYTYDQRWYQHTDNSRCRCNQLIYAYIGIFAPDTCMCVCIQLSMKLSSLHTNHLPSMTDALVQSQILVEFFIFASKKLHMFFPQQHPIGTDNKPMSVVTCITDENTLFTINR